MDSFGEKSLTDISRGRHIIFFKLQKYGFFGMGKKCITSFSESDKDDLNKTDMKRGYSVCENNGSF